MVPSARIYQVARGVMMSGPFDQAVRLGFVDPGPVIEERYRQELKELKGRVGKPRGFWQQRRFNRERRKLKRRVFGSLPRVASW